MTHRRRKSIQFYDERVSVPLLWKEEGSITLETAMIIPFFLVGILTFVFLLEIMVTGAYMKNALHTVGKEMAKKAYATPFLSQNEMERRLIKEIGKERIGSSLIEKGKISCAGSRMNSAGILHLHVEYKIKIPIPGVFLPSVTVSESMMVKGWNGYRGNGVADLSEDIVYVTETGNVYHRDSQCSYLKLSIRTTSKGEVGELRNCDGEKYKSCEMCMRGKEDVIGLYITESGNKYHSSLDCSGLKRHINAVSITEVGGMGACSKCTR